MSVNDLLLVIFYPQIKIPLAHIVFVFNLFVFSEELLRNVGNKLPVETGPYSARL